MSPQSLVEEIGHRLGVPLALDDAGLARLMFDGDLAVDFEFDEMQERLFVCAPLGVVPAGPERERLFADLLAAHLFGAETGPCAPALDAERGDLLLWFAIDDRQDIETALRALENLVVRAEHWRARLLGRETPPNGFAPPPQADFDTGAFLRA